ncbi:kinase-like domain-containing protein [Radiomyces spectabilis]|uniref:kinase-like domain-containing protein n=1 Tax=Radiomyces spectabilis TaxID=64574 RepID=UPI0022210D84|nr:kinase-like domain-containing protein [Radiomyces spectabilis]KAI8384552.1 kinase-like domain-containing protein [Radiomyces spectabilis]
MNQKQDYWTQFSQSMVDQTIGDYQLIEELGHGSYGCLFLGQSLRNNEYVAVKVLSKQGLDHQQLQLQQLEIDIQSSLKHPYLLGLHNVIQDDKYVYMVMDVCDQGDLFDYVIRDQESNKVRNEAFVKKAFMQILEGIEYMHAHGIYHRDLKLENILLKDEGEDTEDLVCKVADFGLATRERYSMEFGCGSTTYLAPEHFDDDNGHPETVPYDAAASDVWSLGVLLLALLFGRNPWQEASSADAAFVEYKNNPSMLKQHLFPLLSADAFRFLSSVLSVDAHSRPSVAEMKAEFSTLSLLDEDQSDHVPVNIPCAPKQTNHASYDSAFFSTGANFSWSDMVDDDDDDVDLDASFCGRNSTHSSAAPSAQDYEDTDMFVHTHEKESWWL